MRRLIINADDFGLTAGVNRAILEAHEHGVVTATTLMANGPEFDHAVQLAQAAPELSVGCHVVLVDGPPLLSPAQIPSLVIPQSGKTACFRGTWASFALAALRGRLLAEEIEAEATAQIRKLQSAGIAVSHLDTHKHTHVFPQVLQPLLRAARNCSVSAIRNPFEPARVAHISRPRLFKRWAGTRMLHGFGRSFKAAVKAAGLHTPNGCLGIVATGALDQRLLSSILENLPQGTWELVCHPGYADEQLRSVRTRLRESRAGELRLLTSPGTRELLARNAIELVSYRDVR